MGAVVPLPGIGLSTDYSTWIGANPSDVSAPHLHDSSSDSSRVPDARLHRWRVLAGHVRGDSSAESVEILVFPSPSDYMLTSFGFSLII
jgi:hypothetical protein